MPSDLKQFKFSGFLEAWIQAYGLQSEWDFYFKSLWHERIISTVTSFARGDDGKGAWQLLTGLIWQKMAVIRVSILVVVFLSTWGSIYKCYRTAVSLASGYSFGIFWLFISSSIWASIYLNLWFFQWLIILSNISLINFFSVLARES